MKQIVLGVGLALSGFATSAVGQGVLFDCDLANSPRAKGWISSRMAIVEHVNSAVQVIDGILIGAEDSPKSAQIVRNDDRVLSLRWVVDLVSESNQKATMEYSARLNRQNLKVQVTANPRGYSNNFTARGDCQIRDQ